MRAVFTITMSLALLALLPRLAPASQPTAADPDAHLDVVADEDGVTILRSRDDGPARFVAKTTIAATPEAILRVLLDYERQKGRFPRIAESRILHRAPGLLHVYQRLALPIVSDRDYTLRVEYGTSRGGAWVRYRTDNDAGPGPRDGIVRAPRVAGEWRLVAGNGCTRVRFELTMDLGGMLPGSLTRRGTPTSMRDVMRIVRESVGNARAAH